MGLAAFSAGWSGARLRRISQFVMPANATTAPSPALTSNGRSNEASIFVLITKCYTSGTVHDGRTLLYRASKRDCDVCPIRAKCCTTADARKIPRDVHEDARAVARRKMKTQAFARSRDERKRVEMRFAHLKTHHGFERMRLRGLSGARDEFHLAAIVQNLKTMALRMLGPPSQSAPAAFA